MWDDTVEVVTFPVIMDRGREVINAKADPVTVTPIYYVDVQPGPSTEESNHRDSTAQGWEVYIRDAPAGLDEGTLMRFRGLVYEVVGKPAVWTGTLAHTVCHLERWAPRTGA